MTTPTIVKLGGSHALSEELPAWLAAVAGGAGTAVLVAGGGPFADAVRAAQAPMGFDDRAADAMALLAMEQFALAIASLDRRFVVAASRAAIAAARRAGRVPVWAPSRVLASAGLPASWDVTSDSLAAWLAGVLGASRLLLVKRAMPTNATITARGLSEAGIVDRAFAGFLEASGRPAFLVGPCQRAELAMALRTGQAAGTPILSRTRSNSAALSPGTEAPPAPSRDGRAGRLMPEREPGAPPR